MATMKSGGCQCGRVRYVVEVENDTAYWCHCRMCQKATGGIAAAFVEVPVGRIRWLSEPDWYQSSSIARRPFCSRCGTPPGFAWLDGAGDEDLTVGSFDDPGYFRPVSHAGSESIHEAWLNTKDLPRQTSAEIESVAKRWQATGQSVPE